jgi:uncharacterized membrane protein
MYPAFLLVAAPAVIAAASGALPLAAEPANNGFWLAWGVMGLLVLGLVYVLVVAVQFNRGDERGLLPEWTERSIPVLAVLGLGVSLYLTYIETNQVNAVCGPVGNCNAVQSSPYAHLFGVLPVGLLGAIGYLAILAAWFVGRLDSNLGALARAGLFGMALFGVLFSIYLTYLELFVIRAVCIWCVSQAALMALILACSVAPALVALSPGEVEDLPEAE